VNDSTAVDRQAQLTAWLNQEADTFPGCRIEPENETGNAGFAWKIFLNDVQMGVLVVTTEDALPEDKIRAHFKVELRKILGQPA
jgi:hypothetical protein